LDVKNYFCRATYSAMLEMMLLYRVHIISRHVVWIFELWTCKRLFTSNNNVHKNLAAKISSKSCQTDNVISLELSEGMRKNLAAKISSKSCQTDNVISLELSEGMRIWNHRKWQIETLQFGQSDHHHLCLKSLHNTIKTIILFSQVTMGTMPSQES